MTPEIIHGLREELKQLEAEISCDPRYAKIESIKGLLALYGTEPTRPHDAIYRSDGTATTAPSEQRVSKKAKVFSAVTDLLNDKGLVHRKEILQHLVELKLMGNENNPMANLASYLNEMKDIVQSDGLGKYRLKHRTVNGAGQKVWAGVATPAHGGTA